MPHTSQATVPSIKEPSKRAQEAVIKRILANATQLGFFLHPERFYESFMLNLHFGHPGRPLPVLICTIYLWAIRLTSTNTTPQIAEEQYLAWALESRAVQPGEWHPYKVMHAIQAEVLLAAYFFARMKHTEGRAHVTAAVSMVASAGLQNIRCGLSGDAVPPPAAQPLNEPADLIEEGERITGLWTVLNLDQYWAGALGYPMNFDHERTVVHAPWPIEMQLYQQGFLQKDFRSWDTVIDFLNNKGTFDFALALQGMEAKAAILWERGSEFSRKRMGNICRIRQEANRLKDLLAIVEDFLPYKGPDHQPEPEEVTIQMMSDDEAARVLFIYTMLCATEIRIATQLLHGENGNKEREKRFRMATNILKTVDSLRKTGCSYVNPVIGSAWLDASRVLVDELRIVARLRASRQLRANHPYDASVMIACLKEAVPNMSVFGANIPLLSSQIGEIRKFLANW
ncbi:hypothetical protein CPC08DRAFT_783517 [Agrocybe pediades]|nr:hypothetical protein CPC08DRAFT_783517 [Agrocybe pediades]